MRAGGTMWNEAAPGQRRQAAAGHKHRLGGAAGSAAERAGAGVRWAGWWEQGDAVPNLRRARGGYRAGAQSTWVEDAGVRGWGGAGYSQIGTGTADWVTSTAPERWRD